MSTDAENKSVKIEGSNNTSASALSQLLSPDGYYTYLNIPCPHLSNPNLNANSAPSKDGPAQADAVDVDLVKKNYRRLSLKHHPDRRGGDPETFRVLNRAKKVLTTPKLRKQYDMLGLDLIDEDEHHADDGNAQDSSPQDGDGSNEGEHDSSSPDTVMSQLASVTLASILQVLVRTALMAAVATVVTRFKITLAPMVVFLAFVAYRVKHTPGTTLKEFVVPLLLTVGMISMHYGRATIPGATESDSPTTTTSTWRFFFGEMLTINMFLQTSMPPTVRVSTGVLNSLTLTFAFIIALIMKGRFWRYVIVMGLEAILALITVLIFPIMEMILEEIMNEKLRKVGEKVRAHAKRMEKEMKKNGSDDKSTSQ